MVSFSMSSLNPTSPSRSRVLTGHGFPGTRDAIVLLNVRTRYDEQNRKVTCASVFVPYGKLDRLERFVTDYRDKDTRRGRRDVREDLIANIRRFAFAAIEALWTDSIAIPHPDTNLWWEVWIRRGGFDWEGQFVAEAQRLELTVSKRRIQLPEHIVRLVLATRRQLESSLRFLNTLAEIRLPRVCSIPALEMAPEQIEWIDGARRRIEVPAENAPSVCLLDRGINRGHPLLEDLIAENHMFSVDPASGTADHPSRPHGTQMAGLAGYGNLVELLNASGRWRQRHRLESVKIMKNTGEHEPDLYGDVTRQGIALPETESHRLRSFCLAVTAPPQHADGRPSSWSAALDEIAVGFGEHADPLHPSPEADSFRRCRQL